MWERVFVLGLDLGIFLLVNTGTNKVQKMNFEVEINELD